MSAGCLMPSQADYVPATNVWPRLESLHPDPATPEGIQYEGPYCPPVSYQATIVDPDPGETMHWRVFVDFQFGSGNAINEDSVPNNPDPLKAPVVTFTTDDNTPWESGNVHIVELLVTDAEFKFTSGPDIAAGAGSAQALWTVLYTPKTGCLP